MLKNLYKNAIVYKIGLVYNKNNGYFAYVRNEKRRHNNECISD